MIVAELSRDNTFKIVLHVTELASEDFEALSLITDLFGKCALGGVLDVSQKVLDTDLLSLSSSNRRSDMDELSFEVSVLIDLLTGEVSGRGQANLLGFLHLTDEEAWHRVVATKDLVDLDVVLF